MTFLPLANNGPMAEWLTRKIKKKCKQTGAGSNLERSINLFLKFHKPEVT